MAPAWPIRLPGGAVRPAMNAATGLLTRCRHKRRGFFFGRAADLADHEDPFRRRIALEHLQQIDKIECLRSGRRPCPTQVDCPSPAPLSCQTAS